MNMQDNELDDLFRSKLGGMEIEPSAHVWDNIAAEIGSKKKSIAPVLRIAATILILLAAGTWFWSDEPAKVQQQTVARQKPAKVTTSAPDATSTMPKAADVVPVENNDQMTKAPASKLAAHKATHRPEPVMTSANERTSPIKEVAEQPLLVAAESKPALQAVVPDGQIAIRTIDTTPAAIRPLAIAPVMAANKPAQTPKKRHGIHSLGDLINVVVAKVDKREDKLIEFTETDDEDSNITGLNLGIIRVKKENK
jgi:hypothetical protein